MGSSFMSRRDLTLAYAALIESLRSPVKADSPPSRSGETIRLH